MSEGGSLLRQTLMDVDECFVYKVPPLTTSGGHRAEHWDLANPVETCGFQVERRDNDLYLLFTLEENTKLFALSKLESSQNVESVVDSSRYFVSKIQNAQGKSTLIGFGFRERDVAIDLLGNLQQFQASIEREIKAKNMTVAEIPTLAEGEKMHISFGAKKSTIVKDNKKTSGGTILLKKPPNFRLSMGEVDLEDDHKSVASTDSDVAHTKSVGGDSDLDEEEKKPDVELSMENLHLEVDHDSVASTDSDVAHTKSVVEDSDDEEDEWNDFQEAS